MNTSLVGLTVSLRSNIAAQAPVMMANLQRLVGNFKNMGASVGRALIWPTGTLPFNNLINAFRKATEETPWKLAVASVVGGFYATMKYVSAAVDGFNAYDQSLQRLNYTILRWNVNTEAANAQMAQMRAMGLSTASAAGALSEAFGARLNPSQAGILSDVAKNLAGLAAQSGGDFAKSYSSVFAAVRSGNAGMLEAMGIPYLSTRLQAYATSMQDLMSPFGARRAYARRTLFTIMQQELRTLRGEYEKFEASVRGRMYKLSEATHEAWASIGKALAPMVAYILAKVTDLVNVMEKFARTHPGLTRMIVVMSALAAMLPGIITGFRILQRTIAFLNMAEFLGPIMGPAFLSALGVIGVAVALFAYGWKTNFMGMGDTLNRWVHTAGLIFRGVGALIKTLHGDVSTIDHSLYVQLKNSGVWDAVKFIMSVIIALRDAVVGFWTGLKIAFTPILAIFALVVQALDVIFQGLGQTVGGFGRLKWIMEAAAAVGLYFGVVMMAAILPALMAALPYILAAVAIWEAFYDVINTVLIALRGVWALIKGIGAFYSARAAGLGWAESFRSAMATTSQTFAATKLGDLQYKGSVVAAAGRWSENREAASTRAMMGPSRADMEAFSRTPHGATAEGPMHVELTDRSARRIAESMSKRPIQVNANIDGEQVYKSSQFYDVLAQQRGGQ